MNLVPRPRVVEPGSGHVPDAEPAERRDPSLPAQGYRLRISAEGVEIAAADDPGAFYARRTLDQIRRLHPGDLPEVNIEDHPDRALRGVMLDVSRDKVPTVETLKDLIDRLASWKINHVQLYMEHTFAYEGHEEVWAEASPYTPDDIRELDAFCRERHVELTPNQNCLGHMGRWLIHDRYRSLAVDDEGWTDPFGGRWPPWTMNPSDPGALELVRDLLGQLTSSFTSGRVHVGLDEPFSLPGNRMGEYIDYLRRLRQVPELEGREMIVWGDIVISHPGFIDQVPEGVTVCVWGYEAKHPFDEQAAVVREAGLPLWVCPGTSSWLSLGGRLTNARANIASGATTAQQHDAEGFMVCDWGDLGHLQYLPVSEPPLAYAAGVSWCLETNRDLDIAAAVNVHAFDDPEGEIGPALVEIGDLYRRVTPQRWFMSPLVLHLYYPALPVGQGFTEGMTTDDLFDVERKITSINGALSRAKLRRHDAKLVIDELRTATALLAHLCRDARARLGGDGTLGAVSELRRTGLAEDLQPLIERHEALWLARNRPGGLADSRGRLENLARAYREPPQ